MAEADGTRVSANAVLVDAAAEVIRLLAAHRLTAATAESLTGGLLGQVLTEVPGASAVYRGGVITYATDLKEVLAGVDPAVLESEGAVAGETAAQMAAGCARACRADWGMATTGVAGPEPQEGQPVGTVFVAVSRADGSGRAVTELALVGGRQQIREQSVAAVLHLLRDAVAPSRHDRTGGAATGPE